MKTRSTGPLIRAEAICVQQGGRQILRDVSFGMSEGEIVTIVGPNGSGKSSLLKALIGALPLASGRVTRRRGLRLARLRVHHRLLRPRIDGGLGRLPACGRAFEPAVDLPLHPLEVRVFFQTQQRVELT